MAARLARLCKVNRSLIKRSLPREYPPAKVKMFNEIREVFDTNSKIVIFHFNSLSGEAWTDLHCDMKKEKFRVKKFPNKLVQVSLKDTKYSNLDRLFKTNTGLAFCNSDDITWKSLVKRINHFGQVEIIGALIDGTLMKKQHFEEYTKLPSISQLHGELIQLLSLPANKLQQTIQKNQTNLVLTLDNLANGNHK